MKIKSPQPLKLNSKYILPMFVAYITFLLASDAVAFKFIAYRGMVVSGVTILFPFTYLLNDVITEVYGYDVARKLIWLGSISEVIFVALITWVISLPYPSYANYQAQFQTVDGNLMRFILFGIVSNFACAFVNIFLISKLKIRTKGKLFWLRSIFSTAFSELILCGFSVFGGFTGRLSWHEALQVFFWTYLLELIYCFIFVWPAWAISNFVKNAENIDAYDYNTNYNPFKIVN